MDIDTNEQLIAFCQEALRIPSYSGQEQGVAELMKRKMEEYGFDEVIIDRFGSVLGTINGKRPGKTVLMDGHIDTVDVIDAPQWEHDPFGGEIADGKIYGRGASDMKGSDCAMITAAARFAEKDRQGLRGPCLRVVHGMRSGSRACPPVKLRGWQSPILSSSARPRARPSSAASAAGREVVVETEGVSCHSSNPEKGVNAVYAMTAVIDEIRKIVPNEHPLLGKGILELTDIISQPYPGASVVPSLCRATFDRRTLVGEDEAVILGQVNEAIARAQERTPASRPGAIWPRAKKSAGRATPSAPSAISRPGSRKRTASWCRPR